MYLQNSSQSSEYIGIVQVCSWKGEEQLPFHSVCCLCEHFLLSLPSPRGFSCQLTTFEEYCSEEGTLPRVLSKAYNLLNCPIEKPDLQCLKHWETDLWHSFSIKQKCNIIQFALKSTICTKIQETNYKILTRWYRTPNFPHKFYPATTGRCWRCQEGEGKLLHRFGPALRLKISGRRCGGSLRCLLPLRSWKTWPSSCCMCHPFQRKCRQILHTLKLEKPSPPYYRLLDAKGGRN